MAWDWLTPLTREHDKIERTGDGARQVSDEVPKLGLGLAHSPVREHDKIERTGDGARQVSDEVAFSDLQPGNLVASLMRRVE